MQYLQAFVVMHLMVTALLSLSSSAAPQEMEEGMYDYGRSVYSKLRFIDLDVAMIESMRDIFEESVHAGTGGTEDRINIRLMSTTSQEGGILVEFIIDFTSLDSTPASLLLSRLLKDPNIVFVLEYVSHICLFFRDSR